MNTDIINKEAIAVNVKPVERIISVVAGSAMLVDSLLRKRAFSTIELITGASMIMRGLSGFCPMNKALGRKIA